MIEKSAKVNLFVKKLSETEIKVEYRVAYFSSIVLYHFVLLFVNYLSKKAHRRINALHRASENYTGNLVARDSPPAVGGRGVLLALVCA